MSWTEPGDIRARWIGAPLSASDEQLTTLIADAEDTAVAAVPDLADRVDRGTVPVERVVKVVARMVMRHLRNPEGTRSTQKGAGPYQTSVTYGGDEPGAMWLTDADLAELGGGRAGGAFTIDTTPVWAGEWYWTGPDTWEPV